MDFSNYFDYNATTPTDARVYEAMESFNKEKFHNPSSFYRAAGEVANEIDIAREKIAKLLNCNSDEIFFTGSGTESDNLAIIGTAKKFKEKGNHIITTKIEHPAVLESCKYLEKNGFNVTYLSVDKNGMINLEDLKNAINPSTIIVSIMFANNEIGVIQPIKKIAAIVKEKDILFHTDAVQAVGKIKIDVNDLGVDLLSLSSHKIYGVKGVGVLFKKKRIRIEPLIFGGGQENGLRAGTENVAGIIGTGKAAEIAMSEMEAEKKRLTPLKEKLIKELFKKIPELLLNSSAEDCLYNTLNISIKHIEGEAILALLDVHGLAFSSGSACSSKSLDPSHVLLAIGLEHAEAHGSLRISLGKYTTEEGVNKLIKVLPPVVERLRSMSPFWDKDK